jgi:hypothetical protein
MTRYVLSHGRRIAVKELKVGGIKSKPNSAERFIKVPLRWAEQATRATRTPRAFVSLWLLHLAWRAKAHTFPLPNGQLAAYGVTRLDKHRALRELEAAGLIKVVRQSRKTPIVTLLFHR